LIAAASSHGRENKAVFVDLALVRWFCCGQEGDLRPRARHAAARRDACSRRVRYLRTCVSHSLELLL
jgi:hypothetical protein